MNLDNELLSWEAFAEPKTNPTPERYCLKCQQIWTSHTGVAGYNRCPHCRKYYNAFQAERLIVWAKLAREQQARKAVQ